MELTWQDVKEIVDTYEFLQYEQEMYEREWNMDEDQTGIPYPNEMSRDDMFKMVARMYNKQHNK